MPRRRSRSIPSTVPAAPFTLSYISAQKRVIRALTPTRHGIFLLKCSYLLQKSTLLHVHTFLTPFPPSFSSMNGHKQKAAQIMSIIEREKARMENSNKHKCVIPGCTVYAAKMCCGCKSQYYTLPPLPTPNPSSPSLDRPLQSHTIPPRLRHPQRPRKPCYRPVY